MPWTPPPEAIQSWRAKGYLTRDPLQEWQAQPYVDSTQPIPPEVSEDPRNYVGVPPDTIPERLLTSPTWASAYHRLNNTQPTPADGSIQVEMGEPQEVTPPPPMVAPRRKVVDVGYAAQMPPFQQGQSYAQMLEEHGPENYQEKLAVMPPILPRNGPGGNGTAPAQLAAMIMGGAMPSPGQAAGDNLTPTQRALKAAWQRQQLAMAARIGGTAIGRGNASVYDALDRAAGQPMQALEAEQSEADRQARAAHEVDAMRAQQAEALRKAGLDERAMKLKEMEPEWKKQELANDRLRAQASLLAARQRAPDDLPPGDPRRGMTANQRAQYDLKLQQLMVPGYDFAPGTIPTTTSAEQLRKGIERVGAIRGSLNTMRDVYDRQGAEFGFGADLNRSQAARQEVLLNLKELENLGVLQKIDVDSLSQLIPDPNSVRGALDSAGMRARFDEFDRVLRDAISTRAAARNYVPTGAPAAAPGRRGAAAIAQVASDADFDRLPSGTVFIGPDGKKRRKP